MKPKNLEFLFTVKINHKMGEFRCGIAKDDKNRLWHNAAITSAVNNKNIFKLLDENPAKVCTIKTVNWSPVKCYGDQMREGDITKDEIADIVTWYVEENISHQEMMREFVNKIPDEDKLKFMQEWEKIMHDCKEKKHPFEIYRARIRNLVASIMKEQE